MSEWRFLALEKPRRGSRFRLKDRILCSLGLALGIFFLILSWGVIVPMEALIKHKVLGSLPDRIQATRSSVSMGPLALGGSLDEALIAKVRAIPGVMEVYRQAHFPDPCQLRASYRDESLVTDLVLEMADVGQVAEELGDEVSFVDPGPGKPVPAVMPRSILDLINSGISVNTNLPQISESALVGKYFDLHIGTSSFRPGPSVRVRCILVGVSDQIGAGGPAIPYAVGERLTEESPQVHALTLKLDSSENTPQVIKELGKLGLTAPRQAMAQKVTSIATLLKVFASLLPLAVLSVTAIGLGAVLELQVSKERQLIALYRALGASQKQITSLYLVRAVSVAILSLVLGVFGATLGGLGLANFLESKISPDLLQGHNLFAPPATSFVLAALFCFGLTLAAAWYPARKAARLDPAELFREPN